MANNKKIRERLIRATVFLAFVYFLVMLAGWASHRLLGETSGMAFYRSVDAMCCRTGVSGPEDWMQLGAALESIFGHLVLPIAIGVLLAEATAEHEEDNTGYPGYPGYQD